MWWKLKVKMPDVVWRNRPLPAVPDEVNSATRRIKHALPASYAPPVSTPRHRFRPREGDTHNNPDKKNKLSLWTKNPLTNSPAFLTTRFQKNHYPLRTRIMCKRLQYLRRGSPCYLDFPVSTFILEGLAVQSCGRRDATQCRRHNRCGVVVSVADVICTCTIASLAGSFLTTNDLIK